ncbi:uncharacterized protein [Channa argus]|uniref:uncharacterized protein n=1 Tax=Channa argus TaxID=215402 RepID=UPI003522D04F
MKDPCRICGVRLVGSQCRWIFSSSGNRKLQVILSHVLGKEVTRDGHGEFLCGKCVFQLEKVIQCDINISQLQDEHNVQIQKLQAEKEHLIQCIVHVYNKNNPSLDKNDKETSYKSPLGSFGLGSPDDEAICQLASKGQQVRESGSGHLENRMRRCVSLDRIINGGGVFPGRSGLRRLGSRAGLDGTMKSFGLRGTRHRSQSMYLDLVQRKGTLPKPGFRGRSTSLQSLNRDFSSDTPTDPPAKLKLRTAKLVARHSGTEDPGVKVKSKALLHTSLSQPFVISDLIELLRCLSKQQMSCPVGSHIPVLKRISIGHFNPRAMRKHKVAEWKHLHDLTEEFDDEYAPVSVKVVNFRDPSWYQL